MEEVSCRDFSLTEGLNDHAREQIQQVKEALHRELDVHVYLKREGRHLYSAIFKTRQFGRNFISKITGQDIYAAMDEARLRLVLNLRHFLSRRRQLKKHRVYHLKHSLP